MVGVVRWDGIHGKPLASVHEIMSVGNGNGNGNILLLAYLFLYTYPVSPLMLCCIAWLVTSACGYPSFS